MTARSALMMAVLDMDIENSTGLLQTLGRG